MIRIGTHIIDNAFTILHAVAFLESCNLTADLNQEVAAERSALVPAFEEVADLVICVVQ